MTVYNWEDPATGSGMDSGRNAFNEKCLNLVTLHAGDDDPPTLHPHMLQVRTDLNAVAMSKDSAFAATPVDARAAGRTIVR